MPSRLAIAATLARRELRGAGGRFLIFLASLALGVAAIAAIGSLAAAIAAGLRQDARVILGGDVELRLAYRPADAAEMRRLAASGRVSHVVEMRAMAKGGTATPVLAELKAVDAAYPLFGAMRLDPALPLAEALAAGDDGVAGAVAERALAERLGLGLGDFVTLGAARYRLNAYIAAEPDRALQGFSLGPRLMIAEDALGASGLAQPGALVYHAYRLDLGAEDAAAWREAIQTDLPKAGWRVRGLEDAASGVRNFIERTRLFLTLVGFSALLIGGIGIANAVAAWLAARAQPLAVLKALGASAATIFAVYGLQILTMAALGIALGLALGAAAPFLLQGALGGFGLRLLPGLYAEPLLFAAAIGLLTAAAFALTPLLRAQRLNAAQLFRARALALGPARRIDRLVIALAVLLLAGFAIAGAADRALVIGFAAAAVLAFTLFFLLSRLFHRLATAAGRLAAARAWPLPLRLAQGALARAEGAIGAIALSLGLGLTALVTIGLIQASLGAEIRRTIPEQAPSFYFIDIQPDQVDSFAAALAAFPGAADLAHVPMLRGRIVRVKDKPAEALRPAEGAAWVLRGDRGITWAAAPPANARLTAGSWWPADYAGPTLISFDAEAAAGLGLKVGDALTVNVLGREIEGRIANLREVDWTSLGINFVMIFSPGAIAAAPQTHIATIRVVPERENELLTAMVRRFPNVSAIAVKEALANVERVLANVAWAVRGAGAVVLLIGALVLASAMAGQGERRIAEAVLLKTLGGRRRDLAAAYAIEFLGLGLVVALLALGLGALAAWLFLSLVLESDLVFDFRLTFLILALSLTVSLLFGFIGAWRALNAKAAPYLRDE